jgi:TatD DNase family protein
MASTLIDFHCHLDLYPDFEASVRDAEQAHIYTLAVTTTPQAWPRNLEATRHSKFVRAGLGLHPQLVAERHGELELWKQYISQTRYVGEVGLDAGPSYYQSFDLQKQVFARILKECATLRGKILSVHSVRAATPVLDLIETHLPAADRRVVLHWFTGTKAEARRAVELGCYFSINHVMVANERGRSLIATLPKDRLLTETDGPFTQIDGRPARPTDVQTALTDLANICGTTGESLANTMQSNLRCLLDSPAT